MLQKFSTPIARSTFLKIFFGLAVLIAVLDLSSKYAVDHYLKVQESVTVIPHWLRIIHLPELNKGSLWSLGGEYGHITNYVLLTLSSIFCGGIIGWAFWPNAYRDKWVTIGFGLVLGGAIGNVYDRALFGGVRDFIHAFHTNAQGVYVWDYPVFNIADCGIVCGAILLLFHAFFIAPKPKTEAVAPPKVVATPA